MLLSMYKTLFGLLYEGLELRIVPYLTKQNVHFFCLPHETILNIVSYWAT